MNIDHNIIVAYFKSLAANHKLISSFFRMDLTEIQGSFRSTADFPCMVIESHDGNLEGSNRQQTVNDRTFAFTIYENPKRADFDDQNSKLAICENIGLAVIARMKHDATLPSHFIYNKFKVETVSYGKVGPLFNERLYGYRFIGSLMGNEPLNFNPADWEDEPLKCE